MLMRFLTTCFRSAHGSSFTGAGMRNQQRGDGSHLAQVTALDHSAPLAEIQELVLGFVPPQGLIRVRDVAGKYERLLERLSPPLPDDAFPQQVLFAAVADPASSRT